MELITSIKPVLAVLIPLAVIPVLVSSGGRPNVREAWTFIAGILSCALVASMVPAVLDGNPIGLTLFPIAPGADIALSVDALGMLFALVASSLYIITAMYSIGYMRGLNEHSQTRFVAFFALAISATIGAAFSANLITLYLFYEILSLATYPLVTHHQDEKSKVSGRRYLTFILGTSIGFVLPAMIWCYHTTGTLEFSAAGIFEGHLSTPSATVLLLMFVFGFAKAGIMPVHSWLPAAMVAPTPVSALLHAVAVVKVGVFSIVRVLTGIFGVELLNSLGLGGLVAFIASVTILVSSAIALSQDEFKRRLAYSTIGQLSYIVLGAALLSPKSMTGGILHITMHAFGKITLFFCAGAIYGAAHKKEISEMEGLGKVMPFTFGAFAIASLSMIGAPPVAGFVSKWKLLVGSVQAHQIGILLILLPSPLLNAAYFLPVTYRAFFGKRPADEPYTGIKEAPLSMLIPILIACFISVVIGIFPNFMMTFVKAVVG